MNAEEPKLFIPNWTSELVRNLHFIYNNIINEKKGKNSFRGLS